MLNRIVQLPLWIRVWVFFAIGFSLIILFVNLVVQQNFRQDANDPQIQIAEDAAMSLNNGASPDSLVPKNSIDVAMSLDTFVIIFDQEKKPIAASVKLDGKTPVPPPGVLDYVLTEGENRLTWQPKENVRIAAIVVKYDKGTVLVGRSLREVEIREHSLNLLTLFAWLGILFESFFASLLLIKNKSI